MDWKDSMNLSLHILYYCYHDKHTINQFAPRLSMSVLFRTIAPRGWTNTSGILNEPALSAIRYCGPAYRSKLKAERLVAGLHRSGGIAEVGNYPQGIQIRSFHPSHSYTDVISAKQNKLKQFRDVSPPHTYRGYEAEKYLLKVFRSCSRVRDLGFRHLSTPLSYPSTQSLAHGVFAKACI